MAEVRLTEDGRLVNVETGEEFGRNENGRIVANENAEEVLREGDGGADDAETVEEIHGEPQQAPSPGQPPVSSKFVESESARIKSHMDSGPTSFETKRTKYEVTPETTFMVRFGLAPREDGGFYAININAAKDNPEAEEHWAKFRMWTYDEELRWKADCMEFNAQSKAQYLNMEKLNERKIKMLLLDWSFGEHEDRLKLKRCDGRLSDESYSIFCGMYPVIADSIVSLMNSILENG